MTSRENDLYVTGTIFSKSLNFFLPASKNTFGIFTFSDAPPLTMKVNKLAFFLFIYHLACFFVINSHCFYSISLTFMRFELENVETSIGLMFFF